MFPNLEPEPLEDETSFSAFQRNVINALKHDFPEPPFVYTPRPRVGNDEPDWLIRLDGKIEVVIEAKEAKTLTQEDVRQAARYAEHFKALAVLCISPRCSRSETVKQAIRVSQLKLLVYDDETNEWEWDE